jgi:hypothetical protein
MRSGGNLPTRLNKWSHRSEGGPPPPWSYKLPSRPQDPKNLVVKVWGLDMDMSLDFGDIDMDFDSLDVLPTYNLHQRPSKDRLARLRKLLRVRGLDGYLIVDSDAHYTFYSQARQDRRINYITNSEVLIPKFPRTFGG